MSAMTIDELARRAGTTTRNIRAYQTRGLLPPPRLVGRTGQYDPEHLARLRLIARLRDRGFALESIRALLDAWQQGSTLSDVLGFTEALEAPWSEETPESLTRERLGELFPEARDDAALVARAVELRLLEPEGEGYVVPSPRLLRVGAELVAAGVPLSAVLDVAAALHGHAAAIAERLVELFRVHVWEPFLCGRRPEKDLAQITVLLQRLRPLASEALQAFFSRAMEEAVEQATARDLRAHLTAPATPPS